MIDENDPRLSGLEGGYRVPYDPIAPIRRLEHGDHSAWEELWENLHHQGDVGVASYVGIVFLIQKSGAFSCDENLFDLALVIELARKSDQNPSIPKWLEIDYKLAWRTLGCLAVASYQQASEGPLISSAIGVMALCKGQSALARLSMLDEDERLYALNAIGFG